MKICFLSNRINKILTILFLVFCSTQVIAEGIFQHGTNLNQSLRSTTTVYVHVPNAGDLIRIHLCREDALGEEEAVNARIFGTEFIEGQYEIAGPLLANLVSPSANIRCNDAMTTPLPRNTALGNTMEFAVESAGIYGMIFDDVPEINYARWDISVLPGSTPDAAVDATAASGNLFSYRWIFNAESYDKEDSVTGQLYILTPGGFPDTNYVWALDLQEFSGYVYEVSANDLGVDPPASGKSAPSSGNRVTPKYPVYLTYPVGADPNPTPNQIPALTDTFVFVSAAGEDAIISPDGDNIDDTGNFQFTPDVDGTYAITIDINQDGIFGTNDRLLSGEMTANVLNAVTWDGTDNAGAIVANANYPVNLELRVGEFHFIAQDVETSGGGTNDDGSVSERGTGEDDGLTILEAIDATTLNGTLVFWDDETLLAGGSNLPAGILSSTEPTGPHRHTWGNFSSFGFGDRTYIDTYVFGNSSQELGSATVKVNTPPAISNAIFQINDNAIEGSAVGTLEARDEEEDVLRYRITEGNTDGVFSISELTGEITVVGRLDATITALYTLTVEVSDSVLTDTATITIEVNNFNIVPEANPQIVLVVENTATAITLTGVDIDMDTLTFSVVDNPVSGILSGTGPNQTYTPNANYAGPDSFTFLVNDNTADSAIATVVIDVLADSDGDGTPNTVDPDNDNDGIPDSAEGSADFDRDGIPNNLDPDSDNDGILDADEGLEDSDSDGNPNYLDQGADGDGIPDILEGTGDADGDGIADYLDPDSDNDGLSDAAESNVAGNDADSDGIDDAFDVDITNGIDANNDGIDDNIELLDTDNDGTPNHLDIDSDGDRTPDIIELAIGNLDTDNDGIKDSVDVDQTGGIDSDSDGIDDIFDASLSGGLDADRDGVDDVLAPSGDTDGDGVADYIDRDSDDDGISDTTESGISGMDTDNDTIDDRYDIDQTDGIDSNNDGIDDAGTALDTDGDAVPDMLDLDSDNDGLSDPFEADRPAPSGNDLDGDGIDDAYDADVLGGSDLDSDGVDDQIVEVDTDQDGNADFQDADADNDGLGDALEQVLVSLSGSDADGDGIDDAVDVNTADGVDANADGIADATLNQVDADGDGIANFRDLDSDGDGISDGVEGNADSDGDGVPDYLDTDPINRVPVANAQSLSITEGTPINIQLTASDVETDADDLRYTIVTQPANGTLTGEEAKQTYTPNPGFSGADSFTFKVNDGADDSATVTIAITVLADSDGDGTPDEPDSDNDGIPDSEEGTTDSDGDGIPNHQDPDSDNDGIPDSEEGSADSDGDGIPDSQDTDSDNDGIPDSEEGSTDSDGDGIPNHLDPDSDNDSIPDSEEGSTDSDGDGIPNYQDPDSDNDGIPDGVEGSADSDGDGIPNYLDPDSDNDGIPDSEEGSVDSDGDGIPDSQDPDSDNDGIPDGEESTVDSDGDGIPDSEEGTGDSDGDGIPDSQDADSDNDGIPDADEGNRDSDADGIPDYLDQDSDGDAIPDILEGTGDAEGDGIADYLDTDSDNDGLSDAQESMLTGRDEDGDGIDDAFDVDQTGGMDLNNDGIDDGVELRDTDNDGTPDATDIDSDNDGIPDVIESTIRDPDSDSDGIHDSVDANQTGGTDADNDGIDDNYDASITGGIDADLDGIDDLLAPLKDTDGDGTPDYLDRDSDGDGISDTAESGITGVDADNDEIDDRYDVDQTGGVDSNNDGIDDAGTLVDTDGDNVADMFDLDSDNDSLFDTVEAGVLDADENALADNDGDLVENPIDTDADGIADFRDIDSSNEGINDIEKTFFGEIDTDNDGEIDPTSDADQDGIDDAQDLAPNMHGTLAANRDQDQDGIANITEGRLNTDGDSLANYLDHDSDNDGLSDAFETDRPLPSGNDMDGDGIDDTYDVDATGGNDADNNGVDDIFVEVDTDQDGRADYLDTDADNDGLSDSEEQVLVPLSGNDADNDGIDDAVDVDVTGGMDADADGIDDATRNQNDVDGDGIPNFRDLDSDGDGIADSAEGTSDTDGDGIPDYLDADAGEDADKNTADSDNDGIPDIEEDTLDTDNDGLPNYLDPDSDNDGIADGLENGDFNGDGINDRLQAKGSVKTGLKGSGSNSMAILIALIGVLLMQRKKTFGKIVLMLTPLIALTAQANEPCKISEVFTRGGCWYLGAGLGISRLQPDPDDTSWRILEDEDTAFKVIAGFPFTRHFYAEFAYEDMGTAQLGNLNPGIPDALNIDYSAYGANVGYLFRDQKATWNLYAKAGLSVLDTPQGELVNQQHGSQFTVGAGIHWRFAERWFARLDFTSYDKDAQVAGLTLARYLGTPPKRTEQKARAQQAREPEADTRVVNADTDADGVPNNADNCPHTEMHDAVNASGCPLFQEITLNIYFDTDKAFVKEEFLREISAASEKIKQSGDVQIIIEGHTDWREKESYNQRLSELRAAAVARIIRRQTGLTDRSLEVLGHGELQPVADNNTAEGRSKNRRVVVTTVPQTK